MNDRIITISPVTRIEGHAKISIFLDENDVVREARFQVTDFRGFEKFCEGRPFYEMPGITSRACGICPVSHLIASAKACDEIASVRVPEAATLLRRLMHMGQLIQSHALSFFHLSAPDLLLGMDYDPSKRNIIGLINEYPDLALKGVKLRKFGQEIIEKLAGKRIHSSQWIVPGGVTTPLTKDHAENLIRSLPEALNITLEAIAVFKKYLAKFEHETHAFGDFPTYYVGLVNEEGELEHYDGRLRIMSSDGSLVADKVDPARYDEYIGEAVEPWSYMKFPYLKSVGYPEGAYRVGPLARLNIVSKCGTPLADAELKEFKKLGKNGIVQCTFHYHYARLIETLFCIETAKQILENPKAYSERVWARAKVNADEGVGVAEAPRGTLIHHYKTDKDGLITWVNMIIATEHNNLAFNRAVTQVAKEYVKGKHVKEGCLNRVEAVVRALDPCLSCATHAVGQMPLEIRLFNSEGDLIDSVTR